MGNRWVNSGQIIDDKAAGSTTLHPEDSGRGHSHKEVAVGEVDCQADTVLGHRIDMHPAGEVARRGLEDPRTAAVEVVVGLLDHTHLWASSRGEVVGGSRGLSVLALVAWFLDCLQRPDKLTSGKFQNVLGDSGYDLVHMGIQLVGPVVD